MKALSIKQPYISWIIAGFKRFELRSWQTNYRGPLLLCASKQAAPGYTRSELPAGLALATAELINIKEYTPRDALHAVHAWRPGLYAWELQNIEPIKPFPVRGQLGLFKIKEKLLCN